MNRSDPSDRSNWSDKSERLMPSHGGYRKLRSYQVALAVYDATVIFCDRFIERRSRTHDQMVQAARSGVRNIAEGSTASGTSKKTELKLTNVARASLEELMGDYEDYLRQHRLSVWEKESPEALAVRKRDGFDPLELRSASAEVAANTLLCLINQASYLLRRQLERLDRDFREQGGFTERLYSARTEARQREAGSSAPACPYCGKPMRRRTARQGPHSGQGFWGCSAYPDCKGTRPLGQ